MADESDFEMDAIDWPDVQPASPRPLGEWAEDVLRANLSALRSDAVPPSARAACWEGTASTTRALIHQRPLQLYERVLRSLNDSKRPEEAHYMERLMRLVYGGVSVADMRS